MKILITGMNKLQCTEDFYLRQQLKVIPSHYSLTRCLRDMGHEVIQREVKFGDKLDVYDKVIVFLAGPRQLVAVTFYSALWAISQVKPDKLIFGFDDWQTKGIFDGILSCKDEEKLYAEFVLGVNKKTRSDIEKYTKDFMKAIDIIGERSRPILLSAFAGGEKSLLVDYPDNLIYTYNPNPYHHNRRPGDRQDVPLADMAPMEALMCPSESLDSTPHKEKIKMFNFASLVQSKTRRWLKKQNIKNWEIEYFGSKKDGQRRLAEGEMVKVYNDQWACLMPGYDHAGSGWWRARPLQVADAESILIGDFKEMMLYYNNRDLAAIKAEDVESMSDVELSRVALAQKEHIYKNHPLDKEIQRKELMKILRHK